MNDALRFQIDGVPDAGDRDQLRARDRARELLGPLDRRELIERAVQHQRGRGDRLEPVARVVRDRYVWQGLSRARSFAEFDLMRTLWLAGLPVPRPLAAAVWRGRFTYRAAILTARIAGATPLSQANRPEIWSNAGRVIAEMHRLGAWHADLNVFNILIDDQAQVWLIDFDRGHLGHLTDAQRADNLSRLLRSVRKVVPELESSCWASLNKAYHARWHDSEKAL